MPVAVVAILTHPAASAEAVVVLAAQPFLAELEIAVLLIEAVEAAQVAVTAVGPLVDQVDLGLS
jgi:hypothetical protein